MFLNQISLLARSIRRLRLGLALSLTMAACGVPPEADVQEEPAAPVASKQQAVTQGCLGAFNQCNARCARLEQRGQDASICYSDCSSQFFICECRENPFGCFQN